MQVGGSILNLFPLENINNRFKQYYMDKDGQIYSMRGGKSLAKLAGSKARSWSNRYFTLDGATWEEGHLIRQAKAHKDFIRETQPNQTQVIINSLQAKNGLPNRAHAANVEAGIKGRGYVIATVQNGKLVFGESPAIHLTTASLKDEMERLATSKPGAKFVSLQITGSVIAGTINWE